VIITRRFRNLVRELIAVSEQICSAQLREAESFPANEAEKKPLRPSACIVGLQIAIIADCA
jgi:hypothetical protein